MTRKSLAMIFVLVLGLAFLSGAVLKAQSVLEGKITGTVADDKGEMLPGVNVELTGPAIMGKRATLSSAKGMFVLLNVPPGKFTMTVSLPGFKTWIQENLILGAGSTLEVNPVLQAGAIEEQITVLAASPIVDVKTSTVDSRLEKEMLAKLPSTRDAFYDIAIMTPGMFEVGSSGSWLPSPTAYGGSSMENVFLINGVNTTDPRGASFGTLVNVNYNAVEEVRVVALGARAEYGSYSGAAIDVLTRSGSNQFHGNVAYYTELRGNTFFKTNQPKNGPLSAPDNWLYVLPGDVLAGVTKKNWEGNFTLGGPIVKDKVWFYGAFDYIRSASLPVNWNLLNEYWGRYADLKISAEPFAKTRAWVSYHREWNKGNGWSWGSQPEWDTSMTYGTATKNNTLSSQWQWLPTSNAIFTAKYLGFWTDDQPFIPADAPDHPGYINWYKWALYGVAGAFPYIEGYKSSRQTVQADMSYYAEDFLGEHDIKFGVQFTKGRGNSLGGFFQNYCNYTYPLGYPAYAYSGGNLLGADIESWKSMWYFYPGWYDFGDYDYVDPENGLVFLNNREEQNPYLTVRTADSLGFFLDDQWSPTKRLTLNLGLRYDRMTTKYGVGKIYEMLNQPSDINSSSLAVIRDRASSANLFDFRTFSPRFGITYQLTKDGKTVLRLNYGRYYMPLAVEFLRRFGPDMPLTDRRIQWMQVPWDEVDLNDNGIVDFGWYQYGGKTINEVIEAVRQIPNLAGPVFERQETFNSSWSLNVADNVKDMHTDQVMVNLERELVKDLSLSASYIYKHAADMFVNLPINRLTGEEWAYVRVPFTLANGQTVNLYSIDLSQYPDLAYIRANGTFRVENMQTYDGVKPQRTYQAIQFVLNKRYSNRWQGLASLVYSWSNGTAQRTMRQNDNMMGPMITDDTWMGSLNYTINNMEGPLPFVPKWEIKVSGSYSIPVIGVDLGLRFRFSTGRPLWRLYPIPSGLWGSPIVASGLPQVVGNIDPTILPSLYILDLRAEKAFNIKRYGSIHFVLDAFNIFNAANVTNADYFSSWGRIEGVSDARRFRLSFMYQF
jgi:outer membrane receptor protein involved in Fe transport